jgi:DNA-directed RNA polymerase alpha subunit
MNRQQIEEIKNLGKKSLREILNKIKERGYKIKQV